MNRYLCGDSRVDSYEIGNDYITESLLKPQNNSN